MEYVFDSGAYAAFKPQGYLVGPKEAAGPYNIPNVVIRERIVYTNKIPCGHMRAPGDPQGFFANESQMDLAAQKVGIDPALFRKKNLMHDSDISPIGHKIPYIKSDEILEKAIEVSGYRKPKRKFTGRGLALAQWQPLGGEGNARVTLNEKGEITVATAMVDQGAGTYTAMCQVAAETLQMPLSRVRVETLDTSRVGPDTGVGASRATRIFGNATHAASLRVKESLLDAASEIFGVAKERLTLTGDGAIRTGTSRRIAYGEIVEKMGSPISHQGSYKNFDAGPEAAMCVQVAEVEVDSETGQVSLKQFTTAHSTGTVINPLMHQGQIDGGVVMGTGYALMEGITIEAGKVVTTHFGENKIPTIRDIPLLKTVVLEEPVGNGPFGAMSIGEPPLVPVAAAIANAVHDAIGVRIYDLPITAEKVLDGIISQRSNIGGRKSGEQIADGGQRLRRKAGSAEQ